MRLTTAVVIGLAVLGASLLLPEQGTNSASIARAEQDNGDRPMAAADAVPTKSDFLKDPDLFPKFLAEKSGCNFSDEPLADALQFLANQHEFDLRIKVAAFEAAGTTTDSPVTLKFDEESPVSVTLEELLNLILRPLELGWRVDGDVLIVSTIDDLNSDYIAKQYDLARTLHVGHSIELIKRVIHATGIGRWEESDNGRGTITTRGDMLIIRQTYTAHRGISRLLATLESPQRITPLTSCSNTVRIRKALREKLSFKFADTPLADAVLYLATQFEIPILLDHSALEAAGAAIDAPITLELTSRFRNGSVRCSTICN